MNLHCSVRAEGYLTLDQDEGRCYCSLGVRESVFILHCVVEGEGMISHWLGEEARPKT